LRGARLSALITLGVVACGGAAPEPGKPARPAASASASAGSPEVAFGAPRVVPKLRVLPDVDVVNLSALGSNSTPTSQAAIVGRMRVELQPGGRVARADEVFPVGRVFAERVPPRLGGGFIFLVISAVGSQLFRSETWLGRLSPLTTIGQAPDQERPLVMGFDRLFIRLRSGGELFPIDLATGAAKNYGPLPPAAGYGEMAFVDAYRAVVDTDITGPYATFDAGTTWARLPVTQRIRLITAEHRDPENPGDILLMTDGGAQRLTAAGALERLAPELQLVRGQAGMTLRPADSSLSKPADERPGPLGKRPLRAALVRGYPDSETTAVVVQDRNVCRVSLEDGALLRCRESELVEAEAACHGIALGDPDQVGVGFVCSTASSGSVIFSLQKDLTLRSEMRFQRARTVVESGQGALVVHGSCGDEPPDQDTRPFCVRFVDGSVREIRLRGNIGGERVVALLNKTVAIVVPPRPGSQGQLTILSGSAPKHLALAIPESAPRELDTGMWLEGFHQTGPNELAGWVEGGGPTFGVRIQLDGQVTVEPAVDDRDGVLVSGRFGLKLGGGGAFAETTDTGRTWTDIVVPDMPRSDQPPAEVRCSAVGCLLPGAFKVGWGATAREADLEAPSAPKASGLSAMVLTSTPAPIACSLLESPKPEKRNEAKILGMTHGGWSGLGNEPAPPLDKGEVGIDVGANFDAVPVRLYAWGQKDTDWSRTGRMQLRFGDRFSQAEVRSSSVTASPWSSEGDALSALGQVGGGMSWQASLDGNAALTSGCRGDRQCLLFATEAGQPVVGLRMTDDTPLMRPQGGAVRVGATWFFLGDSRGDEFSLFRADLGTVRLVSSFKRALLSRVASPPRLVRKARGSGLGFLFVQKQGPNDRRGMRYVLPIDPESGELGEVEQLGRADFGGVEFEPCGDREGWLVEAQVDSQTVAVDGVQADSRAVELRMRLRHGKACVEAGVVRSLGDEGPAKPRAKNEPAVKSGFPLILNGPNGVKSMVCHSASAGRLRAF
jgi:hypothetical protein